MRVVFGCALQVDSWLQDGKGVLPLAGTMERRTPYASTGFQMGTKNS